MEQNNNVLLPGQSSQSTTNSPSAHHESIPSVAGPSTRPENQVVVPSAAGPSTLQSEEESIEPVNSNWGNDDIDSSSDESMPSEGPKISMEEKMQRRLSFYQEIFDKSFEPHMEERAEGRRKRKVEDLTPGKSPQMEIEHHHNYIKRCFKKAMEEANMQGYVYGIVLHDNKGLSGCSQNLHKWWVQNINFEHAGPAASDQFYSANQQNADLVNIEPPRRTYDLLMQLSDATMGAILSALVHKCDPPQHKFPYESKVAPPWWPTGDESWWDQTSLDREPGQPPYRKPRDMKKKWKVVVMLSVIKNMAPNFGEILQTVLHSKNLQNRLSVREMNAWNSALREEMKIYSQEHPHVPLSDLLSVFQAHFARAPGQSSYNLVPEGTGLPQQPPQQQQLPHQQQHQVFPMANQPGYHRMLPESHVEIFPWSNRRRMLRFTCKNQGCIHHDNDFGFYTATVRDNHQQYCKFQSPVKQFASMVPPSGSTSPVIVPPMHPPQQMLQSPFPTTLPPQSTPISQMFGSNAEMISPQQTWLFNAGIPNYPLMSSDNRDMGQNQPSFNSGGFYNTQGGSGGNTGSYMQLLNEIHSNALQVPAERHLQGSSSGGFQQTAFPPFEPTEMQFFPNNPAVDRSFARTQTNVALPEGTQFRQTGPPDGPLAPNQPSVVVVVPNVSIPQASSMQHSESHEVQIPTASAEPNQFATGNSELSPESSFFQ